MKKTKLILATSIACIAFGANAQSLEDKYFSKKKITLTPQEQRALDIAKRWKVGRGNGGIRPFTGQNGTITYVYGVQAPSVVCAVLQVCDLALEVGEQINSLNIGDPARWTIEPSISGSGGNSIQHLIIKPHDVGLETSLIVSTDRRMYHINLRSTRKQFMPQVSFTYPEQAIAKFNLIQKQERTERENNTITATREYLGDLSFDYKVWGSAAWKPVRVFNDGVKTVIEMPEAMSSTEAPTLLVVRNKGNLFSSDDTVMVNYRLQGNRYIVDAIFDRAILISGVGNKQKKVTIQKGEGK